MKRATDEEVHPYIACPSNSLFPFLTADQDEEAASRLRRPPGEKAVRAEP